ncbi:MAG: hypothetical protein CSA09_00815 [Candidatus Contendobacter odensis]|uniref:Cyclic nucleotide-binding domain-containing protein n=1 Tax=Candidatus Contendibacter odensensis TaxID=1400860 RepID=A0A2G6PFX3_9GAMM|nr:MAG: hypothetical protein CSA09_00815 [Candidatus Contendobacter odensis]
MPTTITIVNAIGFEKRDRRIIRNILSVISNRDCAYHMATGNHEPASIVLVNADDAASLAFWNEYQKNVPNVHTILASSNPILDGSDGNICIKRPLIASQLHEVLALGDTKTAAAKQSVIDILQKSFLFRSFPRDTLKNIVDISSIATLPAGHVLFETADTGSEMFVLLSGQLKVSVTSIDGEEIVLGSVGVGEIVGEIAMLDGRGRSAGATTLKTSKVLVIHRKDFMPFLSRTPKAATALLMVLALRLRLNTEQLTELIALDEPSY